MRICSIAIDNLEFFNYQVEYSSNRLFLFDLVIWFGGDEKQCYILKSKKKRCLHPNIQIVNMEHRIKNGIDVSLVHDLGYNYVKMNYPYYSIYAIHTADELLTDYGINAITDWIYNSEEEFATFAGMSNKLLCETSNSPLVFQIMRNGVEYKSGKQDNYYRFCNGIKITSNYHYGGNRGESNKEHLNYMIDIGYACAQFCCNKIKNWTRMGAGDGNTPALLALYEKGDKEGFIKQMINLHRKEFHGVTDKILIPVKYEGEYKEAIDDLGLKEEYDIITKLVKEINGMDKFLSIKLSLIETQKQ